MKIMGYYDVHETSGALKMSNLRTIEIDFDVHKRIELERRDFDEPPIAALRRLLGLDGPTSTEAAACSRGRPWSSQGVTLENGTDLRMRYNGRQHTGRIDDGDWLVEGQRFKSPSGAGTVARTKDGRPAAMDGWEYWEARRPGDKEWVRLDQMRKGIRSAA